ncbi:MAG: phosphatase PAP2 family protein [Polynucleobacter sp.]|jgi:membrane-associated phospholipid phosphatase|nr:phosphatase PAP2 family protein [Polynucleobacter sp.]
MYLTRAWALPLIPLTLWAALLLSGKETELFLYINQATQVLPSWLWAGFSFLGNGWGIFALSFPLILFARRQLVCALISGAFAAIIASVLKPIINLPRPAGVLPENSFHILGNPLFINALPSGHTLTAFAIASAYFFSISKQNRNQFLILFLLAAFAGISRNAVGAHWPSDILIGSALGIWCGLLASKLGQYVKPEWLDPKAHLSRLIAISSIGVLYVLQTQTLDFSNNSFLQDCSSLMIVITLILFIRLQVKK